MSYRPRDVFLGMVGGLILLAGLVLGAWALIGPDPGSDAGVDPGRQSISQVQRQVNNLAKGGDFDRAQALVSAHLKYEPDSVAARLMLAELMLDRKDPQPEKALETLRPIRTDDPVLAAQARLDEGKAFYRLSRFDAAESAWKDALRIHPTIAEAGWALLNLYYIQGRRAEAHRLAMTLFKVEPDPRDRAQLLLELIRQDAEPVDPASTVISLRPVVQGNPKDLHSMLALGLDLVKDSRADEGLEVLRRAVEAHPQDPDAWDARLTALGRAGRSEELAEAMGKLPPELAESPRFARHRALVAWDRRDWKTAASAYRQAWEAEPDDHEVLYRLGQSLSKAGETAEAEAFDKRARAFNSAREGLGKLYDEANADPSLGMEANPDLYRRLADAREQMGRHDEAIAWHRVNLRTSIDDAESLAALERLAPEGAKSSEGQTP